MSNAYEADLVCQSFVADTDFTDKQYYAVDIDTNEEIFLASDAGDYMLGVLQDEPAEAGRVGLVALEGITKAVGGAAINAGAKVQVDNGGKFKTYVSGARAGIAMTPCGGDGQLFSLKIDREV